jgi:peptidoglycan/xylan/chitin deacetylase (PgdA/CDA1 family)
VLGIFHDIEENMDCDVSPEQCRDALHRMLEVEDAHRVRATYNVVGEIFKRVAPSIAHRGHSMAFHTYNHRNDSPDQLAQVRGVDLQVKGYRTAQSVITSELTNYALGFHNFEWLMSSAFSYGFDLPRIEHGIVKIPAHVDDHALSTGEVEYGEWLNRIMMMARGRKFLAIGLHDCYSEFWLAHYSQLLERLKNIGELWTCDQITNHVYLKDADVNHVEL